MCPLLIELVFAENSCLTEIGWCAFQGCKNLQRMNAFPVGLLRLRQSAYGGCVSLPGELLIPCTVVRVDRFCFQKCGRITSVVFHNNPTPSANPVELGRCVFAYCRELQSAQLPQNIVLIPEYAFYACTSLLNIPLPLSVEEIEDYAFYRCFSLQSINLPERTIRIGDQAYKNCTSLEQVTIRAIEAHYGQDVFTNCPALSTIQVFPSLWTQLFESMQNDPSFLFHFVRKYQACKWTA